MWCIDTPSWNACASVNLCILLCVPLCRRGGSVGVCMLSASASAPKTQYGCLCLSRSVCVCVSVCACLCISVCLCVSLWVYACGCVVRAWYTNGKYTVYTLRTLGAPLLKDNRHRWNTAVLVSLADYWSTEAYTGEWTVNTGSIEWTGGGWRDVLEAVQADSYKNQPGLLPISVVFHSVTRFL
jgi:hypothetical protein